MGINVSNLEQLSADDLIIFAAVVEASSFTQASEQLKMPKSTVSRRISLLEEQMGERLLLRTTRRLSVTELGEQVLEHAKHIAHELQAAQDLGLHRQAQPSGRLRVSMPSDFANLMLVDMLAAFTAMHPKVLLEIDLSARRVDLLSEGFDVAVRMGALPDDSLLVAKHLLDVSFGLYAAPSYIYEHGEPQTPDELFHHQAVRLLARTGEPAAWDLCCGEERWKHVPPGQLTANSLEILMRLGKAGRGIIAVPEDYVTPDILQGKLVRILPKWCFPSSPAWAVYPGRKLLPAKTRAFLDMLYSALQKDRL
ncbi:LysR substrate-binding domain-containing protein [Pseudomonas sp. F1_0610]|uniref:LysR family transcriptional regulator n=1 Tax=Pseudomonas sp. F1_0610 TaxID=3114284 RepID=UPI0039C41152